MCSLQSFDFAAEKIAFEMHDRQLQYLLYYR